MADKNLYLLNLETIDINDPAGKKWYRHETHSLWADEQEIKAKVKKLLDQGMCRDRDHTFGGLIQSFKPKGARVQVRKVQVLEDRYILDRK